MNLIAILLKRLQVFSTFKFIASGIDRNCVVDRIIDDSMIAVALIQTVVKHYLSRTSIKLV